MDSKKTPQQKCPPCPIAVPGGVPLCPTLPPAPVLVSPAYIDEPPLPVLIGGNTSVDGPLVTARRNGDIVAGIATGVALTVAAAAMLLLLFLTLFFGSVFALLLPWASALALCLRAGKRFPVFGRGMAWTFVPVGSALLIYEFVCLMRTHW